MRRKWSYAFSAGECHGTIFFCSSKTRLWVQNIVSVTILWRLLQEINTVRKKIKTMICFIRIFVLCSGGHLNYEPQYMSFLYFRWKYGLSKFIQKLYIHILNDLRYSQPPYPHLLCLPCRPLQESIISSHKNAFFIKHIIFVYLKYSKFGLANMILFTFKMI